MRLREFALCGVCASLLSGCGTSGNLNAGQAKLTSLVRQVEGTDLIGVAGKTADDQARIDNHNAGMCGAGVWTASECARLDAVRAK